MFNAHQHSTFSDGVNFPEEIARASKELGYSSVALTDHGGIGGYYYLQEAAKHYGLKPVYGVEFYIIPQEDLKTKVTFHTTVLAKNLKGLYNIYELITLSNDSHHFYRKPRITLQDLYKHSDGLIVLSGCVKNPMAQAHLVGDNDTAKTLLDFYRKYFDFYYEVMPYDKPEIIKSTKWALQHKIKTIATLDSHFVYPRQQLLQKFILVNHLHTTWDKIKDNMPLVLLSEQSMFQKISEIYGREIANSAITNIAEVENKIETFELPSKAKRITTQEDIDLFKQLLKDNMHKIPNTKIYEERLKKEVNLIYKKEYIPYFLEVYNIVNTAKQNGILTGYGRGSAVSSLVCYILGITKIDPIEHDLLFERFISESRKDAPDIDLDFDNNGRLELVKALSKKQKILQISTLNLYKVNNLIDDIVRIFQLDKSVATQIKSVEINTLRDITNPQITKKIPYIDLLPELEGKIRYVGRHASGFILDYNLEKYTPTTKDNTTPFDYHSVGEMNLLKFDILGLKTLSVVKEFQEVVDLDIDSIKPNDIEIFHTFGDKTLGLFQFEGEIPKLVASGIKPENIKDLAMCSALARPGSLHSGLTRMAIRGDTDYQLMQIPGYDEITKDTRHVLVYQEQIMQMCRTQNIDWDTTEKIRKLISKSKFEELMKYSPLFENQYLWNKIVEFGQYAFNKSHAIAYTYLSYLTGYLKKYYPLEFYYANLRVNPKDVRFVMEAMHSGIPLGSIKDNMSYTWNIVNGKLCPGFNFIEGIQDKTALKLERDKSKANKITRYYSNNFELGDYFKEYPKYSEISKRFLTDLIYVEYPTKEIVPFKIKKKIIDSDKIKIIAQDYSKVEVMLVLKGDSLKRYSKEIEEAKRQDVIAGEIVIKPWSNVGVLYRAFNLTKRKGIKI